MKPSTLLKAAALIVCGSVYAQETTSQELAQQLANERTREDAVERIVTAGTAKVPILLSWTRTLPQGVNRLQLYIGLADVFGRLRTKEAIPFLVDHISLQRGFETPPWMKAPHVIEDRLPAARALIEIGPEASRALIRMPWGRAKPEDRLPTIFVISQISGVPEARAFLVAVAGEANIELHLTEDGLKLADTTQ